MHTTNDQVSNCLTHIRRDIARQILKPGAKINEVDVAKRMGVSRTPAREAIRILTEQGILDFRRNKGATVRIVEPSEIMQVYEMRVLLELYVIRLGLPMFSEKAVRDIETLYKLSCVEIEGFRIEELNFDGNFWKFNDQIHFCFFDVYGNSVFKQSLQALWNRLTSLQLLELGNVSRIKNVIKEHEQVLAGIKNRNVKEACHAMKLHLISSRDNMIKEVSDNIAKKKSKKNH